jgi:hypothetical protein
VPETPGYVLQRVDGEALACVGDTLGQASATWASPDGRMLELLQGRPFPCGDLGEDTLLATPTVSGLPARYSTFDTGAGVIWLLRFDRDALDLSLSASFDDMASTAPRSQSVISPGSATTLTASTATATAWRASAERRVSPSPARSRFDCRLAVLPPLRR